MKGAELHMMMWQKINSMTDEQIIIAIQNLDPKFGPVIDIRLTDLPRMFRLITSNLEKEGNCWNAKFEINEQGIACYSLGITRSDKASSHINDVCEIGSNIQSAALRAYYSFLHFKAKRSGAIEGEIKYYVTVRTMDGDVLVEKKGPLAWDKAVGRRSYFDNRYDQDEYWTDIVEKEDLQDD